MWQEKSRKYVKLPPLIQSIIMFKKWADKEEVIRKKNMLKNKGIQVLIE